ncbi:hypothetical protein X975_07349, partial [Stegodyphus mimosarum]
MEDNNKPGSSSKRDDEDDEIYRTVMTCEKEYVYIQMKKLKEENSLLRKKLEITSRLATRQGNHIRELEKLIRVFEQEPPSISYEDFMFNHFNPRGLTQAAYAAYLSSVRSAFHARQSVIFSEKAVSVLSMVTPPRIKEQATTSSDNLYDDPKPSTSSDVDSSICVQLDDSLNDDKQKESTPWSTDSMSDDNKRQGELPSCSNETNVDDNERQRELPSCSTNNTLDDNKRQGELPSCSTNNTLDDNKRQEELPSCSTNNTLDDNKRQGELPSCSTDTSFDDNRRQRELPSCSTNSTFEDIRQGELPSCSTDTSADDNRRRRDLLSCSASSILEDKRRLRELPSCSTSSLFNNNGTQRDLPSCSTKSTSDDNRRQRELPSCSTTCMFDDNRRQRELPSCSTTCIFDDSRRKRALPSCSVDCRCNNTRKKREHVSYSFDSRLNDFRKLRESAFCCGSRSNERKEKGKRKLSWQRAYKAPAIRRVERTVSSSCNNAYDSNGNGSCRVLEKIHFNTHLPNNPFQCGTPTIVTPSTNFNFFRRDYFRNFERKRFKSIIRCKTGNSKLNFGNCKLSRNTFQTNRKVNNSLKKKSKPNAARNKEIKINEEALRNSAKELSMRTKKKKSIRNAVRKDVHDAAMLQEIFGDKEENHVQSFKVTDIENDEKMQPKIMLTDIFSDPNAANDPYVSKIKQDLGWILDDPECPVDDDNMGNEELAFSTLEGFDGANESPGVDNEKATADSIYSFSEENVDYQDPSESKMLSTESVHNSNQCEEQEDEKLNEKSPIVNEVLSEDSATIFMDEPCCSKDPQSFWCSPAPENPPRKGPRTPPHPPPDYSDEEDVYDYGTDYYYESED